MDIFGSLFSRRKPVDENAEIARKQLEAFSGHYGYQTMPPDMFNRQQYLTRRFGGIEAGEEK